MLLNCLRCTGQPSRHRMMQPKVSAVPGLRSPALKQPGCSRPQPGPQPTSGASGQGGGRVCGGHFHSTLAVIWPSELNKLEACLPFCQGKRTKLWSLQFEKLLIVSESH